MSDTILTGIFALAGTMIGGLLTYMAARVDHRWKRAKKHIGQLCDQVTSYYQLEQIYKEELAQLDPQKRSPKTIMEDMRSRVSQSGEYERPMMTSLAANKIRQEWL
ncbi:MAG: hypothetical protein R3E63_03345 [Pseudomonadales bacterium]